MRVVFFGTPALSVATLQMLHEAGHEIALVITQADKRRGRGTSTSPSPIKAAAERLGLPVSHIVNDALSVNADLGVLVAFGRIIRDDILEALNIVNLHPSLLPRWRGATPVEAAILAGDTQTGICVMQLQSEMDSGPIYARYSTTIEEAETSGALYERLLTAGNAILRDMLEQSTLPTPEPQSGEATYCTKITPEDLHIDWTQSAAHTARLTLVGRAWTTFRSKRFLILDATPSSEPQAGEPGSIDGVNVATPGGSLKLKVVQPEGKGPTDALSWANGARIEPGERLGG